MKGVDPVGVVGLLEKPEPEEGKEIMTYNISWK